MWRIFSVNGDDDDFFLMVVMIEERAPVSWGRAHELRFCMAHTPPREWTVLIYDLAGLFERHPPQAKG